ncbi:uncharacterized protein LOC128230877 [Mya arenaria]|uniref:uncharacterized protein LOC128230877 n=1 Tax=Mya arenaria TaxID=6604 RepID=UPI0022E6E42F|nr:uncharacterized protein LOC128230877 [Mya arenaria]
MNLDCNSPNPTIDANTLLAIREMYEGAKSRVRYRGLFSEELPVVQGTRQGGKSSPILYLIYINDLINELQKSNNGLCLYYINMSAPTFADDMVLVSFSKTGMDNMLQICSNYSKRWRFLYNSSKCAVVVFNKSGVLVQSVKPSFSLGHDLVPTQKKYTHLGIICNETLSVQECVQEACTKLRGSYLNICSSGINPDTVSAKTLRTYYQSVILPRALYGCELWTNISKNEIQRLEVAHRFCVKQMQGFQRSVATKFVLSTLNITSIEVLIDCKKLQFFGQMCRLPCQYLAKIIFNSRLIRYINFDRQTVGFVPDIYRLCQKYLLVDYITQYINTGQFPSKYEWKKTIHKSVTDNIIVHLLLYCHAKEEYRNSLWDTIYEQCNLRVEFTLLGYY